MSLTLTVALIISNHLPHSLSINLISSEDIGLKLEELEEAIQVEMGWCHTTDKKIEDLLVQTPPPETEVIDMNIKIYDVSFACI